MKHLLFIAIIFLAAITGHSQTTIRQDSAGNYIAIRDTTAANSATSTGKFFTDLQGKEK
jgi:hypothetical protein